MDTSVNPSTIEDVRTSEEERLPPEMEERHQTELQRLNRITRQKLDTSRILILLLLDLTLSATLYYTYRRLKAVDDYQPVFFWILIFSVFRTILVSMGAWAAVTVGLPSVRAIAREMGHVQRIRHQRDDIIGETGMSDMHSSRHKRPVGSASSTKVSDTVPTTADATPEDLMTPLLIHEQHSSKLYPEKDVSPSLEYVPPSLNSSPSDGGVSPGGDSPVEKVLRRAPSDGQMVETLGLFGTDAAQKLEDETRYHRAVKRVESIAHVRRNFVLAAIFLGLTLSNFVCCVWFVSASSQIGRIFG